MLTWVAYIWKAAETKKLSWRISAVLYTVLFLACISVSRLMDTEGKYALVDSLGDTVLGWIAGFMWIGGTIQAIAMNRSWLRWKAQDDVDLYANAQAAYLAHMALSPSPDAAQSSTLNPQLSARKEQHPPERHP